MFSTLRRWGWMAALVVLALPASDSTTQVRVAGAAELGHGTRAVLWRDPSDIGSRNLLYGAGGQAHEPRGTFTFLEEDLAGSNPKFDVRDQAGVKWKVKLGAEAPPEVAASRLVWAAGYFTNEEYFLETLRVEGLPAHLHRGQDLIAPDGVVHNVRLKRSAKGEEKLGAWKWSSNPFVGTREFNGLRVLMALINNWDLKDENNAIYQEKNSRGSADIQQIYLISDLGASFGSTGFKLSVEGSRGNLEAYSHSKFVNNLSPGDVNFSAPSRPTLFETINLPVFMHRLGLRWIGRQVPRADAKWMGQLLGRLSPDQIRDAFRAAGYSPQDANDFAVIVQGRVAELNAL